MKRKVFALGSLIIGIIFTSCHKDDINDDNNSPILKACFDYSIKMNEYQLEYVSFSNCSQNATSFYWDFGDTNTSTEKAPDHYYSDTGIYTVTLTVSDGISLDTAMRNVAFYFDLVRKPNIYIYPESEINLCVNLSFPRGGEIVQSIPQYNNGWCVNVDPQGIIDGTYNYLFYESKQPSVWQEYQGWCVKKGDLEEFFSTNMVSYGFNENEISDFIEFWIPELSTNEYYYIYPQTKEIIEQVIELECSVAPQNLNRIFYLIEGADTPKEIPTPMIHAFQRDGFTIVEWGAIIK